MNDAIAHKDLLLGVKRRIAQTNTATDHLLLLRWRVLGLCQHLLSTSNPETEETIVRALQVFEREGPSDSAEQALDYALECTARSTTGFEQSILPSIAYNKREAVLEFLGRFEELGTDAITKASGVLPQLRDRLRQAPDGALLAGLRHRLELVASLTIDPKRGEEARTRAAAAILYLEELHDVIPDSLGLVGLLDDDYALRVVLEEFGDGPAETHLHWAETITALWDDLPFMQGIQLQGTNGAVATTWLDRINSYVSYNHALDRNQDPLILLQPSVACSPAHSIVSLIGLLIYDGLTSSKDLIQSLVEGHVYEIDAKYFARFLGVSGSPVPGWLRLEFRDAIIIRPPTIADRMVAVPERSLSKAKSFSTNVQPDDAEPIQKFFDWDEAIGAASLSTRVLFVTSRQRANELFGNVASNGVRLIEDGLVRFSGLTPDPDTLRGGLVIVVPNLTIARKLVDYGVEVQAIVIDGYERLRRGRHDLPFLSSASSAPPIIVWSPDGYFPIDTPAWLPNYRRLQVSQDDLSYILELDGVIDEKTAPSRASLWEAATSSGMERLMVNQTTEELSVLDAIKDFQREVRSEEKIPEYWQYHLFSSANILRLLITATPANWNDIRAFSESWRATFQEQWETLRSRAAQALAPIRQKHQAIFDYLSRITAERNSKGDALLGFLSDAKNGHWHVVCDRLEQIRAINTLVGSDATNSCSALLQRDLPVCSQCIVIGWPNRRFARRLWSHTPSRLVALVDPTEAQRWTAAEQEANTRHGDSVLEAVGYRSGSATSGSTARSLTEPVPVRSDISGTWRGQGEIEESLVPCVFVCLVDESDVKVLSRDDRVLTAVGDRAREKRAYMLLPDDSVILGPGHERWSPADEFTQAVLKAIEMSHPALVEAAKEWRKALFRIVQDKSFSIEELQLKLEKLGVSRGPQTLSNWLDIDRPSPIGPMSIDSEISAIWRLVGDTYTEKSAEEVSTACSQLRSLRSAAGRSLLKLWEGRAVDLGVDDSILSGLVEKIREQVLVHEVESVTFGEAPDSMIGWWVSQDLNLEFDGTSDAPEFPDASIDSHLSEDDCD